MPSKVQGLRTPGTRAAKNNRKTTVRDDARQISGVVAARGDYHRLRCGTEMGGGWINPCTHNVGLLYKSYIDRESALYSATWTFGAFTAWCEAPVQGFEQNRRQSP